VGKYGLGQRNTRGEQLEEFSRENSLVIVKTNLKLFEELKRSTYTWKMPGDIRKFQIY